MRKILFLTFFCIPVSSMMHAQSFDVKMMPERKNIAPRVTKYNNSYYYFEMDMQGMSGFSANLKRMMHNIRLKKYNSFLEEELSEKVEAPDKSFGPVPPSLKVINNKLYLLYFKHDDQLTVWIAPVDTATLQVAAGKKVLDINEDEKQIQFYMRSVETGHPQLAVSKYAHTQGSDQGYPSFFVESSADGTQHMVAWTSTWTTKMFFSVLDKNFTVTRTKMENLPDDAAAITSAFVDNKANVYFTWHYQKKNKRYASVMVNKSSGSEIKNIQFDDADPASLAAVKDEAKGYFLIGGSYKGDDGYLKGMYAQTFSLGDLKASAMKRTVFPKDLVDILDKDGWANNKEKKMGLIDGLTFEPLLLEDGTLNLTGEFRRIVSGQRASFAISGSLLNARFDKDLNAVYTRIPKARVSAGATVGDSYRVFDMKDKVIIFYNDHLSNLKQDLSESPKRSDNYSNSILVAGIIDVKGNLKREIVKDLSAEDFLGMNSSMQELSRGSFYIPFFRIKKMGGVTNDIRWAMITTKAAL